MKIQRCWAGCAPRHKTTSDDGLWFYIKGDKYDTVFRGTSETDSPSRALCSGGGLVAKEGSDVTLESVVFEHNRGREGGAVVLVGASAKFRDVTFQSNTADAAAALLVASGSQLVWREGRASGNCARGVESAVIEISEDGTAATLIGVTVEDSSCKKVQEMTCPEKWELAYREGLCRSREHNLVDTHVWKEEGASCVPPEANVFRSSDEFLNGGKPFPRPFWSDFDGADPSDVMVDCTGQVDKPSGIRVSGSIPGRSLIGNGDFEGGMPVETETSSWNGLSEVGANAQTKFYPCLRNTATCYGREIVPIDDGPPLTSIKHALSFRRPSNAFGQVLWGEYDVHVPMDLRMQVSGRIVVGMWYRCSGGFARDDGSENWRIFAGRVISATTTLRENIDNMGTAVFRKGSKSSTTSCDDTWRWKETSWDLENLKMASARHLYLHVGYPLQQTAGTLQITGISAKVTPSTNSVVRPPSLRCYGCVLSGSGSSGSSYNLVSQDNATVIMVDSTTAGGAGSSSGIRLPPFIGDGGRLVRGPVRAGNRIWPPALQSNLVRNGEMRLGEHMERFSEKSGRATRWATFGSSGINDAVALQAADWDKMVSVDINHANFAAGGDSDRGCGGDFLCFHQTGNMGWIQKALPSFDGVATVRWGDTSSGGCRLLLNGKVIHRLPNIPYTEIVTTTVPFRAGDMLRFEEEWSICSVYSIDVDPAGVACADGRLCEEHVVSQGAQFFN